MTQEKLSGVKYFQFILICLFVLCFKHSVGQNNLTFSSAYSLLDHKVMGYDKDENGNTYVMSCDRAFSFYNYSDTANIVLRKLDPYNKLVWERIISSSPYDDVFYSFSQVYPHRRYGLLVSDSSVYVSFPINKSINIGNGSGSIKVKANLADTAVIVLKYSSSGNYQVHRIFDSDLKENGPVIGLQRTSDTSICFASFLQQRQISVRVLDSRSFKTLSEADLDGDTLSRGSFAYHTLELFSVKNGDFYVRCSETGGYPFVHVYKFSSKCKLLWHGAVRYPVHEGGFAVNENTGEFFLYAHHRPKSIFLPGTNLNLFDTSRNIIDTIFRAGYENYTISKYDSSGVLLDFRHFYGTPEIGSAKTRLGYVGLLNDSILVASGTFTDSLNLGTVTSPEWKKTGEDSLHQKAYIMLLNEDLETTLWKQMEIERQSPGNAMIGMLDNFRWSSLQNGILTLAGNIQQKVYFDTRAGAKPLGSFSYWSGVVVNYDLNKLGAIDSIKGSTNVCFGDSVYTYSVPAVTHATRYEWELPFGAKAIGDSTGRRISLKYYRHIDQDTLSVLAIRTGQVRRSKAFKVKMLTDTLSFAKGSLRNCLGDTVEVFSNISISMSYLFYNDLLIDSNRLSKQVFDNISDGDRLQLKVRGKHSSCYFNSNVLVFEVDTPIPASVSIDDADNAICENSILRVDIQGPQSLKLYRGKDLLFAGKPRKQRVFTYYDQSIFRVIGVDSNGCITEDRDTLTVLPLPNVNAGSDTVICIGDSIALTASGAKSYLWLGGVQNGVQFVPSKSKSFIVVGVSSDKCENTDTINVSIRPNPLNSYYQDTALCEKEQLVLTPFGGYSYSWNGNHKSGDTLIVLKDEVLHMDIVDSFGCSIRDSFRLTTKTLPSLSVYTGDTSVCEGDSIYLSAVSNDMLEWGNGLRNHSFNKLESTQVLWVSSSNNLGCVVSDSILVKILRRPSVTAGNDTSLCDKSQFHQTAKGALSYEWSTGVSHMKTYTISKDEAIWVKGYDSVGCWAYDTVNVTVLKLPQIIAGRDTALCEGEGYFLTASGGQDYVWKNDLENLSWYEVNTSEFLWVDGAGTNGCTARDSIFLTVLPKPKPNLGVDRTLNRDDSLILFPGSFTSYLWGDDGTDSFKLINYQIQGEGNFKFKVEVTDQNGCQAVDSIDVKILSTDVKEFYYNSMVHVYPNPTRDLVSILGIDTSFEYKVYNVEGRLVLHGKEAGHTAISVEMLQAGLYMIELRTPHRAYRKKIVVDK